MESESNHDRNASDVEFEKAAFHLLEQVVFFVRGYGVSQVEGLLVGEGQFLFLYLQ